MRDDFELDDFLPKTRQAFKALALDATDQPDNESGIKRLIEILLWQARTMPLWLVALAQEAHNAACVLEHQHEWKIGLRTFKKSDVSRLTPLNVGLEFIEADAFILRELMEACRQGRAADRLACWPSWLLSLVMDYRQRLVDALVDAAIELADSDLVARSALRELVPLNTGWVLTLGANREADFMESAWQAGKYRQENRLGNGPTEKRTRLSILWAHERPFETNKLLVLV